MAKTYTTMKNAKSGQFVTVKDSSKTAGTHLLERLPSKGGGYSIVGRSAKTGQFLSQEPVTKRGKVTDKDAVKAVEAYLSKKK